MIIFIWIIGILLTIVIGILVMYQLASYLTNVNDIESCIDSFLTRILDYKEITLKHKYSKRRIRLRYFEEEKTFFALVDKCYCTDEEFERIYQITKKHNYNPEIICDENNIPAVMQIDTKSDTKWMGNLANYIFMDGFHLPFDEKLENPFRETAKDL